ncbi:MAG: hypothetical protein QOJ99_4022 [Bryobacterales bacterium]|jgi:hypothetical protein|nr:hypothetical protein [Bryobacterales bacterium]
MEDCEWIAELLEHGLLKGSFVGGAIANHSIGEGDLGKKARPRACA